MAANNNYQMLFTESVSAVTSTPSVVLGTRRRQGLNEYVYVYNMSTSTINIGYGAVYSAASGYSVTASSVTGDVCVGVAKNADIGPLQYGWLCTKGPSSVEISAGGVVLAGASIAAGDILALASDGTFYDLQPGSSGTGTTWSAFGGCAVSTVAINSGASGTAMLNCAG